MMRNSPVFITNGTRGNYSPFWWKSLLRFFVALTSKTGRPLIDMILDSARQKGTGMWTSQDAMDLQTPMPTIDMAVAMRNLSTYKDQREALAKTLVGTDSDAMPMRKRAFRENSATHCIFL